MRRVRAVAVWTALGIALAAAGWGAARALLPRDAGPGLALPLAGDDQEVAWIAPATSGETWERLVKALRLLEADGVVRLDLTRAFLQASADVPDIGVTRGDSPTLRVRWYKLSGTADAERRVKAMRERGAAPLAIVGGETTDRALALASLLEAEKDAWPGAAPLLLLTTATADRYLPADRADLENDRERWPRLMDVHPGRTFRFSFANGRMVESVLDFVQQRPKLWPERLRPKAGEAPFFLFTLAWLDDSYSKDLAATFQRTYSARLRTGPKDDRPLPIDEDFIQYSVGDFHQPNPREEMAVGLFLANADRRKNQPQLLVLPTGTQRARRFLRTLCRRAPRELDGIVVASGDSISFNNVYRDRDVAWNVQDLPVPLVFFTHRNPISAAAGFGQKRDDRVDVSSTQDLLLFRDLFEALVLAAFDGETLASDADAVRAKLTRTQWADERVSVAGGVAFFDASGNRTAGTGEHVVLLQPMLEGARVLPQAELTVWRLGEKTWARVGEPLDVHYDRGAPLGGVP